MNPLEQLVRDTYAVHAQDDLDAGPMLSRLRSTSTRSPSTRSPSSATAVPGRGVRRPLLVMAGVAAAIAVMVAVPLAVRQLVAPPLPSIATQVSGDTQQVSFHGVSIEVPGWWPINAVQLCGLRPTRDTAITLPGHAIACIVQPPPAGVTFARLMSTADGGAFVSIATEPINVGGVTAFRGSQPLNSQPVTVRVIRVPSLDVVLEVWQQDSKPVVAQRILDSLRIVPVGSGGTG